MTLATSIRVTKFFVTPAQSTDRPIRGRTPLGDSDCCLCRIFESSEQGRASDRPWALHAGQLVVQNCSIVPNYRVTRLVPPAVGLHKVRCGMARTARSARARNFKRAPLGQPCRQNSPATAPTSSDENFLRYVTRQDRRFVAAGRLL